MPVEELERSPRAEAPPLIKGCLACKARVLGAPAWDADFGTAEFPLMLRLRDLPPLGRSRFVAA